MSGALPADAKIYRTVDLYLAAAFLCSGVRFEGGDRITDTKVEFVFVDEVGTLSRIRSDYFSNRLTGDLLAFTQHVKSLKSLVHSLR